MTDAEVRALGPEVLDALLRQLETGMRLDPDNAEPDAQENMALHHRLVDFRHPPV